MDLAGQNIIVLDVETLHSAEDCRHCGRTKEQHTIRSGYCVRIGDPPGHFDDPQFAAIGWENHAGLGLSIGCYYAYRDGRLHWFDGPTLAATLDALCESAPLVVSFNGRHFDGPLMEAVYFASLAGHRGGGVLLPWQALWETSYDILAEIWKVDPVRKFERGLNSLDAISQANGLGAKTMTGAQAPQLWAQGRYAEVIAHNVSDVLKTKALFELIYASQPILRGDGLPMTLPLPVVPGTASCVEA